jgi:hypothetical protein
MMLNSIKSLLRINLDEHKFPFGLLARMQILKCPSQIVMDGSGHDKTILVGMYAPSDLILKSIGHELG